MVRDLKDVVFSQICFSCRFYYASQFFFHRPIGNMDKAKIKKLYVLKIKSFCFCCLLFSLSTFNLILPLLLFPPHFSHVGNFTYIWCKSVIFISIKPCYWCLLPIFFYLLTKFLISFNLLISSFYATFSFFFSKLHLLNDISWRTYNGNVFVHVINIFLVILLVGWFGKRSSLWLFSFLKSKQLLVS